MFLGKCTHAVYHRKLVLYIEVPELESSLSKNLVHTSNTWGMHTRLLDTQLVYRIRRCGTVNLVSRYEPRAPSYADTSLLRPRMQIRVTPPYYADMQAALLHGCIVCIGLLN